MAKNFEHISHIKNNSIREVTAKEFYGLTPTADNSDISGSSPIKLNLAKRPATNKIIDGEIAINFKKGHETILIKNDNGEIVGFVNENDFNQIQEIIAKGLAQEKDDRQKELVDLEKRIINTINSTSELREDIDEVKNDINEMDLTIASALNDLNDRIKNNEDYTEELNEKIDQNNINLNNTINQKFEQLKDMINEDGLTLSSSVNDLNTRIGELEILMHELILAIQ